MKKLLPHQNHVVEELNNLKKMLSNLEAFIKGSTLFTGSPQEDKNLILQQSMYMAQYADILQQRINRF
jgi:hypothetical protein